MTVTMRFIENPAIGEIVLHSEPVKHDISERAQKVENVAKSIAPVLTGAFRDSIHVEEDGERFDIVADSVEENGGELDAAFIEFGTSDTPAHGTLRRALEAAGH